MADTSSYDKARDMAEQALKKTVEGDNETAESLTRSHPAPVFNPVRDA
jgi:hypothetical protein